MEIYSRAAAIAAALEAELRRLGRWMFKPLPDEALVDMGAFGSNTMSFEQWIQFVLIERIREIVSERGQFPEGSNLSVYAVRYFDGDHETNRLQHILQELDELINKSTGAAKEPPTVTMGDTKIPEVLFQQSEILPQFDLQNLESQLQNFDTFLQILAPTVRPQIYEMLMKAADNTSDPACKKRIQQAARDIADGRRAAAPYNHELAMKNYQQESLKNFPNQPG